MKNGLHRIVAAFIVTLGLVPVAQAGFIGRELSAEYFYPNLSTSYGPALEAPPVFAVGSGVETIVNVEGVTTISVDLTDTSILFDFSTVLNSPTWLSTSFNGLVFNLTSGAPLDFSSVSIDPSSNYAGFDASRVSFSDSQVTVNWQGLSYNSDTILLIHFEPVAAQVPEPATMSLLGLGLLGVVAMRSRRVPWTET